MALINLVRYSVLSAREGISTDQTTGAPEISDDARAQLERGADAWNDYLATKPERPNASAAVYAAETFSLLGDAGGAARAQRIVAEKQDSAVAYNQLAIYLYSDGKIAAGDAAGDRAVEAADPAQRSQVEKSMDQLAKLARKYKKQLAKQQSAPGSAGEGLQNPFGGLGGGSASGIPPASP